MGRARRFGPYVLDLDRAELRREAAAVELQPKVFDLLALLSGEPGRIFTKQELLDALWPEVRVTEASLHQAFRKARRALGDDPDHPTCIEAVAKRGWRWIAALEAEGTAGFVGRRTELAALRDRLRPGAAVLLHGAGGVGKTRLAREIASRWASSLVVALGAAEDGPTAVRTVAEALGVALETGDPDAARSAVGRALAARGGLVVLDELERVTAPMTEALAAWRTDAPQVCWLLTSRATLPGAEPVELGGLPLDDARSLLRSKTPTPLSDPEADAILESLDGLPLPIELAAGRLRVLGPAGLAQRLSESLRVLSGPLWASIAASVDPLDPGDRALLAACAVFPRPFGAEELLHLVEGDAGAAVDGLERLLDASLLHREGDRFAVRGLIREFVSHGGSAPVGRWVRWVAAEADARRDRALAWDPTAFLELRARLGDLADAHRRADPAHRDPLAVGIALAARYGGPWDLAWDVLSSLEEPSPLARVLTFEYSIRLGRPQELILGEAPPPIAAHAHLMQARLCVARGELDRAERDAAAAEVEGNDALCAFALDAGATVHRLRGRIDAFRAAYDRALGRLLHPAGRLARASVAMNYAAGLAQAGLHDESLARLRMAAEALSSGEFPHLQAIARMNLAKALLEAGRVTEAEPLLEAALLGARQVGDRTSVASLAEELALARCVLGRPAEDLLDEAQAAAIPTPARTCSLALRRAWAAPDPDTAVARIESAEALAATELQRAHVRMLTVGLARRLGDERLLARALPAARAAAAADPDLGRCVEAWVTGSRVPDDLGLVPADVWVVAGPR